MMTEERKQYAERWLIFTLGILVGAMIVFVTMGR